ncbi:hypothetical protein QQZ08_009791 [Neonectria magnoliae]|uniref:Uncharacterized protein n=1 Tax=Neonectria magnoliae TaxID=2732573 RepID=A0ABR1HMS3_9HYPO
MATASTILPPPVQRTDSDVSPKTVVPHSSKNDYFQSDVTTIDGSGTSVRVSDGDESSAHKSSVSFAPDLPVARSSSLESAEDDAANVNVHLDRKASISSVTFRKPRNPSLPQGNSKQTDGSRIRASSPPHQR